MKAWLFQDLKQIAKHGADGAAHCVGWVDPDGKRKSKSCGPGKAGLKAAKTLRDKITAQLVTGTYQDNKRKRWAEFIKEYRSKVLDLMKPSSKVARETSLKHFERLIKPVLVRAVTTKTIDDFVALRQKDKKPAAPATINHDLREMRAILRKAVRWGYLPTCPEFQFLKAPEKLPTYITPEDFAELYDACKSMEEPSGLPCSPADWWRALLMFAYLTGWRIGALLALRWADVDLENGTALSQAEDNKGGRDQRINLHPLIVERLKPLVSFQPCVFAWEGRRQLYGAWHTLQDLAGVKPASKDRYGFHDLRRAFATMNADRLTPETLQQLMQHRDYHTTRGYINLARQLKPAAHAVFVPELKVANG